MWASFSSHSIKDGFQLLGHMMCETQNIPALCVPDVSRPAPSQD